MFRIDWLLAVALLFMMSCREDGIDVYSGIRAVNIKLVNGDGTFVENETITEKTFDIKLSVQTNISDKNRVIKFKYGEAHTAAEGIHFNLPKEVNLEAGRLDTIIQCTVYKTGLTYEVLVFDLEIAPNEDFDGGGVYEKLQVKMMLGYPTKWVDPTGWAAQFYLGKCTQAKYKFVYEQLGTLDLGAYQGAYGSGYKDLANKLNTILADHPLPDDDGTLMRFGSGN